VTPAVRSAAAPTEAPSQEVDGGRAAAIAPLLLTAGICLAALNLRPGVASISPLLDTIRAQDHLSHTVAGLLTAIPTLCVGVGAFLVPPLSAALGAERALAAATVLIGLATAARLWAGDKTVLFATTLAVGAGIAVGQTLLPGLVRRYFAKHPMLITAMYSLGITVGAAIPAAASAPLKDLTGSWQAALAFWALFALVAVAVLVPIARRSRPTASHGLRTPPWRERRAWQIALFYGGASGLYFVILAWLAPVYEDHGWSDTRAGLLLTLLTVSQATATMVLTLRGRHLHDRRPMLFVSLAVMAVGMSAVAFAPFAAPVLWALLLGVGNGIVFPVMLVLPVDYAEDPAAAARLAAMGFGVGYLLASLGPVLTGGLRDLTGTYAAPFALYAGICLVLIMLASRFTPPARTEVPSP
jgi:CP family cyanate transporter-like MFS transporter